MVEKNEFRFTGLDICAVKDSIEISMEDYVTSLEDSAAIRRGVTRRPRSRAGRPSVAHILRGCSFAGV